MDFRDEFPLRDGLIYLNHAAVAPWPRRSAEAARAFAEQNMREGSWHYREWEATEARLRGRLQRLIGAQSPDDIALVKNTSEALSFVAYGLDWRPGDNVVTCAEEFPSNRWVWESLARFGVETRLVTVSGCDDPEARLMAQVDERTRLIAVSAVQYGTGLRMDLARLGRFCRDQDVLFCVDAIQCLGAVAFDVQSVLADFVAADGHKWMLGPEGLGVFWVRPALRERLRLTEIGWHTAEKITDYSQRDWAIAHSARRFECGSPNMLGIHALEASLSLFEEVGMETVERQVLENTARLKQWIGADERFEMITPAPAERHAGIVTFRHRTSAPGALHAHLKAHDVLCAVRGAGLRFSPHFYTPPEHLARAWELVRAFSA